MMKLSLNETELQQVYSKLQYQFKNPDLLIEAMSHPSLHQHRDHKTIAIYERLEFLGDGVLGMVMSDLLFHEYNDDDEGDLAKKRAYLVSSDTLAALAADLDIAPHIIMAESEEKNGGRNNQSILEDIMEAIIAAIFLDSDYSTAKGWIKKWWEKKLHTKTPIAYDTKTMLQEWSQGIDLPIPSYEVIDRIGSAHEPSFVVEVSVPGYPKFTAEASAIKKAEKQAALEMLRHLKIIPS